MSLRWNSRTVGTALAAKENFPTSDSRAHLVALVWLYKLCSAVRIMFSFSGGISEPAAALSPVPGRVTDGDGQHTGGLWWPGNDVVVHVVDEVQQPIIMVEITCRSVEHWLNSNGAERSSNGR